MKQKIVVGISGGVDSSVAALLLAEQGYDVECIFMKNWEDQDEEICTSANDYNDALQVCNILGLPIHSVNFSKEYWDKVFSYFLSEYEAGRTPNPDVLCNREIKFKAFLNYAMKLGINKIATGHYAKIDSKNSEYRLLKGKDKNKDQSYFLFATTPDQLEFLRFPLGELTKEETRKLAERYELPVAAKPDSQDICFVPQGRYSDVVLKRRPDAAQVGDIVDIHGNVLGQHKGVIHYTVGQRRGLNLDSAGEALYVLKIEPNSKKLIVGPKEALKTKLITLSDVNWLGDKILVGKTIECEVKVRSMRPPVAAALKMLEKSKAEVELAVSEIGVSPGQACVFYEGDRVLGGGWINRENANT